MNAPAKIASAGVLFLYANSPITRPTPAIVKVVYIIESGSRKVDEISAIIKLESKLNIIPFLKVITANSEGRKKEINAVKGTILTSNSSATVSIEYLRVSRKASFLSL